MADDRPVTDDRGPGEVVTGMVDHVLAPGAATRSGATTATSPGGE